MQPVLRYLIADYLDVGEGETPDIQLMDVFESVDESPNANTIEKHYTANKSTTTIVSGYNTQFPIEGDRYINHKITDYLAAIGEEQKLGVETYFIRVNLWKAGTTEGTFYARRFRVGFSIDTLGGAGGEIATISGTMNTLSDVEVGTFDTTTLEFTAGLETQGKAGRASAPAVMTAVEEDKATTAKKATVKE